MFTGSARWIAGVVLGAVGLIITSFLTGIPAQFFDEAAVKDKLRSGPDLRINAEIVALDDEGGPSLVLPRSYQASTQVQQQAAQPGEGPSVVPLLRAADGANLEKLTVQLVVEGRRNQEIRILNIHPIIITRAAPLDGTLFFLPPQGNQPTLQMATNLDAPIPIISTVDTKGHPTHDAYFEKNSISLRDTEQQTLNIRATSARFAVTFTLRIDYSIGGRQESQTVTDHGHPFHVSAPHCGTGAGIVSYEHVFALQGDFSALPVPDPHQFETSSTACGWPGP